MENLTILRDSADRTLNPYFGLMARILIVLFFDLSDARIDDVEKSVFGRFLPVTTSFL